MKTILLLLMVSFMISCTPADRFRSLKSPIILVAEDSIGNIMVTDKSGSMVHIPKEYYIAKTISNTYNVGDTLVYIK